VEETDTFTADGRIMFSGILKQGDKDRTFDGSGTWEIKNGYLTRTIVKSTLAPLVPDGTTMVDKIISISAKELTLQDSSGKTSVNQRVQ
jgi:hypothetical protein